MSSNNNTEYKFTIQSLKPVLIDLIKKEKREIVFDLLHHYFKEAETLEDLDTLGYLSLKAECRDLYLKCAEAAYSKAETPDQLYIARSNLYKAYNVLNQPEKALFYIDINLKLTPDDFETLTQKAFNIALMGDRKTSENMLLELIKKYPEKSKQLSSALSGKMLREGETAKGIAAFMNQTRPEKHGRFEQMLGMRKWDGKAIPGGIVYVDGEGGIGDEIINIRFFDNIRNMGMKPILYSTWSEYRIDTVNLFRRHGYDVITEAYSIYKNAPWTPMMCLPSTLNLDESSLWAGPYLTPLRNPRNKINNNKFKIGIKCSGNPYFSQDEYRKIPIDILLSYLPKDAEIYYIDKSPSYHPAVIDLADYIDSWEDTLDYIDQMDCIVSSCTSLVHAAGAMGKATVVVVPIAEYYIWSTSRKDTSTPWYGDNFHVCKQTTVRDWNAPLTQAKDIVLKMMEQK